MLNALLMFLLMYYAKSRSRSRTGKQGPGIEANAEVKQNDQANAFCGEKIPTGKCEETEKNNLRSVAQLCIIVHLYFRLKNVLLLFKFALERVQLWRIKMSE